MTHSVLEITIELPMFVVIAVLYSCLLYTHFWGWVLTILNEILF